MDFYLSHMSISAILMIADNCNLDHESANGLLSDVFDRNDNPSRWLCEINYFDFIEIIEVSAASNGNARRCVGLVELVITVNIDLAYRSLAMKLDVHKMR